MVRQSSVPATTLDFVALAAGPASSTTSPGVGSQTQLTVELPSHRTGSLVHIPIAAVRPATMAMIAAIHFTLLALNVLFRIEAGKIRPITSGADAAPRPPDVPTTAGLLPDLKAIQWWACLPRRGRCGDHRSPQRRAQLHHPPDVGGGAESRRGADRARLNQASLEAGQRPSGARHIKVSDAQQQSALTLMRVACGSLFASFVVLCAAARPRSLFEPHHPADRSVPAGRFHRHREGCCSRT